jgi:hypothetical protein
MFHHTIVFQSQNTRFRPFPSISHMLQKNIFYRGR